MQVTTLPVVLLHKGNRLPAIDGLSPQQMVDHYSGVYPELATATIDNGEVIDGVYTYTIKEVIGNKG